jgi:hypothetical protein
MHPVNYDDSSEIAILITNMVSQQPRFLFPDDELMMFDLLTN